MNLSKNLIRFYVTAMCLSIPFADLSANNEAVFNYSPSDVPGSGYAKIGYGVNPETDQIMPVTDYDETKFISDSSDKLVFTIEASKREEFTKFGAGAESNIKSEKASYDGGMGLHYGLLSAQAKAAYAQADKSKDGRIEIVQQTGIMGSYLQHFKFGPGGDTTAINSDQRKETAEAIMNAMPKIAQRINKIRSTYGTSRDLLIKEFILNHGTHVITSVLKGYYGQYKSIFSHKINNKSGAEAFKGSISAKGWGVALSSDVSTENGQSLLKENWSFESHKEVFPDSNALNEQVTNLQNELTARLNSDNKFYNLGEAMNKIDKNKLDNFPQIKDTEIQPDKAFIETREKNKKLVSSANKTIVYMENQMDIINSLIKKQPDNVKENPSFKKALTNIDNSLKKFDIDGIYFELNLPNESEQKLSKIRREKSYLDNEENICEKGFEKVSNVDKNASDIVVNDQKDYVFLTWLNKQLGDEKSYKDLNQTKLSKYKSEWEKEIGHKDLNSSSQITQLQAKDKKANFLKAKSNNKDQLDYVVLDMSIVPWAMIFPELGGIGLSNYEDMAFNNILSQIEKFQSMYEYLDLCITYDGALDSTGENNPQKFSHELRELSLSIANMLASPDSKMVLKFNGSDFDLSESSGFERLEGSINDYIKGFKDNSPVNVQKWIDIYYELNKRKLLYPTGNIAYLVSPDDKEAYEKAQYVLTGYKLSDHSIVGMEPDGQEIAVAVREYASNEPAYPVNTLLPIITSETTKSIEGKDLIISHLKFNQYYGPKQGLTQKDDAPIGSKSCKLKITEKLKKGAVLEECGYYPRFSKYSQNEDIINIQYPKASKDTGSEELLNVFITNDKYDRSFAPLVLVPLDKDFMDKMTVFNGSVNSVQLPLFYGMNNTIGTINAALTRSFNH